MTGETNLATLLQQMQPVLNEGEYVFCSVEKMSRKYWKKAIATFREKESLTLVIDKATADECHLPYGLVCSWITLTVYSSLEAVGLTTAFSTALSGAGISCNVIAAFYHDHIFVAQKDVNNAMAVLQDLTLTG